jgi:hypothetical protein
VLCVSWLRNADRDDWRLRRIFAVVAVLCGLVLAGMGLTLSGAGRFLIVGMAVIPVIGGVVAFFRAHRNVERLP